MLSFRLEAARILLAHGADVDAEDEGRTPPQVALAYGEDELVQLVSVGISPQVVSTNAVSRIC